MEGFNKSINDNAGIMFSRNRPTAFVVGAAGFIGSHLVDCLLRKQVQVLGIDDLSNGNKSYLAEAVKDNNFYFLYQSVLTKNQLSGKSFLDLKLARLDYVFIVLPEYLSVADFKRAISHILEFVCLRFEGEKTHSPKIAFISSVDLYAHKLSEKQRQQKNAEIYFAKVVKELGLNARIIRFSTLFGPRMHFREDDPMVRLLQASLLEKLQTQGVSEGFLTRALYIEDAVALIVKTVFAGSTAHKIYDGVLYPPVKVDEVKQILLDPLWHERSGYKATALPTWSTPNLKRTVKEMNWEPKRELVKELKQTIHYFKAQDAQIPELDDGSAVVDKNYLKRWTFMAEEKETDERVVKENKEDQDGYLEERVVKKGSWLGLKWTGIRQRLVVFIGIAIILFGLLFPVLSLGIGAVTIRENIKNANESINKGEFDKAIREVRFAKGTIKELGFLFAPLESFSDLVPGWKLARAGELVSLTETGIEGVEHAVLGTEALYKTTKIISGEQSGEVRPLYDQASAELNSARQKLDQISIRLKDTELLDSLPQFLSDRAEDLAVKLDYYKDTIGKAEIASKLLPELTGVNGKKQYLVLLQNNLELRPTGGFIGSYAKITFENGQIKEVKVDDIYALDGNLKEVITPPVELVNDLGQKFWYLRDSNTEPDFPKSAKQAELFYTKEAGEKVNGVIAMDLSASGKLLEAVGGVDLPDFNEHVDGGNLFEKAITHAEVNFFPGSQAKKNYLTQLQNQLFNKLFFVSKQNWPGIIQALGQSLEEKHILIYLSDPTSFSYVASENWAGVLPREGEKKEGVTADFLAVVESNMGANKVNYYINRNIELKTAIGIDNRVFQNLKINYKNSSPSEVFPAGKYKNRLKIYVPFGAKLNKVVFDKEDITNLVTTFADYGRTGYSMLIEINPKEEKAVAIEYELKDNLTFVDDKAIYNLDVIKQSGTDKDAFEWMLSYPIHLSVDSQSGELLNSPQEVNISTDLKLDRSFNVTLQR